MTLLPYAFAYGIVENRYIRGLAAAALALGTFALGFWVGYLWYKWLTGSLDPEELDLEIAWRRVALVSAILLGIGTVVLTRSFFTHRMVRALDAVHFDNPDDQFTSDGDD